MGGVYRTYLLTSSNDFHKRLSPILSSLRKEKKKKKKIYIYIYIYNIDAYFSVLSNCSRYDRDAPVYRSLKGVSTTLNFFTQTRHPRNR